MRIGPHAISPNLILAPMAGVTDKPFRILCKKMGAGLCVSEMTISDPRFWRTSKSVHRMDHSDEPSPISVQIAGTDPAQLAEAARFNVEHGAQIIDCNIDAPPNHESAAVVLTDCNWPEVVGGRIRAIGSVCCQVTGGTLATIESVHMDGGGYIPINHHCITNVEHIYAAGDVSGKLPLSSVASMQGRKVAEHVMGLHTRDHRHLDYDKAASAIFTEPEIADVGLAEAEAFAHGRKIRVTKVPFSATPKALINNDARGFVKIISDPATGEVLGGSIVGRHAAELISVIALAVTANLRVTDIVESLLVHPALAEALAEAAE